jgi:hypothetical protein
MIKSTVLFSLLTMFAFQPSFAAITKDGNPEFAVSGKLTSMQYLKTSSGKTSLTIVLLANVAGGEVESVESRIVFTDKEVDVGTALLPAVGKFLRVKLSEAGAEIVVAEAL